MKITTTTGLVGLLLALSTLSIAKADATANLSTNEIALPTIEQRLARISDVIKEQEMQIENPSEATPGQLLAGGWIKGSGFHNGGFRNGGGFHNGGFRNGGFLKHRY